MADPLSMLAASKPKPKQAPKAAAAPPATSNTASLFDVGAAFGGLSKTNDSLFDVQSSLGGAGTAASPSSAGGGRSFSVTDRINQALAPASNVDFPMVTEICEALTSDPSATSDAIRLLCNSFSEPRGPPRKKLKALTIMNELKHDPRAAQEVKKVPGARDALWELQSFSGSGLGNSVDEQIRMFATEIEKTCYGSAGDPFAMPAPRADTSAMPQSNAKSFASVGENRTESGYPGDARDRAQTTESGIDWGNNRMRKRDEAIDKFWNFGSKLKDNFDAVSVVAARNIKAATAAVSGGSDLPRPDLPKLPIQPTADRPVLEIKFEGMVPGEKVNHSAKNAYFLSTNPFCETPGRLLVTNYRLKFQVPKGTLRADLTWLQDRQVMDVPLGIIEEIKLESPTSAAGVPQWRLRIITKDQRVLLVLVADPQDLSIIEEHVVALAQPGEAYTSALFAFRLGEASGAPGAGWDIFNPEAEFSRMGVSTAGSPCNSPYSLNPVNRDYSLCSSYPSWLVMPRDISNAALQSVAQFRKRGRLPTMSWCGGQSLGFASLWRCSQPQEGFTGKTNQEDERLVQAIREGPIGARDTDLLTLDLRSKKAAYANKLGGGGFESYSHCRVIFGGIDNVHGVREAWRKMTKACVSLSTSEVGSWFTDISNAGWYDIMGAIMKSVRTVIEELEIKRCNVLIHCSDGWDRTAQVSSLVMLCVDPYFRTIRGLCILIQKEFCNFGHGFRRRLGNGEVPTSEYSPIFVQWIECVYQLTVQFPEAFEFSTSLLLHIGKEVLSNRYGTFLCDNERERTEKVANKTLSFWAAVLNENSAGPIQEHRNGEYREVQGTLRPSPAQINFKVWEDYWFRYLLHPRDEARGGR